MSSWGTTHAVHPAQIKKYGLIIIHKKSAIGFLDRKIELLGLGRIIQNKARASLMRLPQHFDDGRAGTIVLHVNHIDHITQSRKISKQPFQGYAFRSIKRTIKPAHEIALQ